STGRRRMWPCPQSIPSRLACTSSFCRSSRTSEGARANSPMAVTIENPILNSPYEAPTRHWRFDEAGITSTVEDSRRTSAYFMPIARPKKKGAQKTFETEWTLDRITETTQVNRIRERVDQWRAGGYVSITSTTRRLLEYWNDP